jgi:prevent-host-death family protein
MSRHVGFALDDLAVLMDMSTSEHLPLADVKNRLSEVIERLEREHGRVVVTRHGRPAAMMLSIEELESLEETLEIMSNPALLEAIREAERDVATARTVRLAREEALARLAEP